METTDGDVAARANGISDAWVGFITTSNGSITGIVNENSLTLTTSGPRAWNGPYMADIDTDPWGTKYYFNGADLAPSGGANAAFVLSAGPDKTIDTVFTQTRTGTFTVGNDDIVQRIR